MNKQARTTYFYVVEAEKMPELDKSQIFWVAKKLAGGTTWEQVKLKCQDAMTECHLGELKAARELLITALAARSYEIFTFLKQALGGSTMYVPVDKNDKERVRAAENMQVAFIRSFIRYNCTKK